MKPEDLSGFIGRSVRISVDGQIYRGAAIGIDSEGKLTIVEPVSAAHTATALEPRRVDVADITSIEAID